MSYCRYCGHETVPSWTSRYDTRTGAKEMEDKCTYRWCSNSDSWDWMMPIFGVGIIASIVAIILYAAR